MSERVEPRSAAEASDDLEDLFDHAPCGYLVIGPDVVVARINETLGAWLGLSPEQATRRPIHDFLTTPARIIFETNIAPSLRLQSGFEEVLLDFRAAGGEKLPVLLSGRVRSSAGGELVAVRLVAIRAKDRRGYERDLREREKAARKDLGAEKATAELREQFIAVLGHDLRNPLASIVGAARLLRREVQSDKAFKILEMMEASVDRMAGLIDDVMDFARGRLGSGIDLHRQATMLEPVLRQVVAELEANNPSRMFVCEIDAPEAVSFDPGRISQLVSNLLGNALVHGDPRAPVRLQASMRDGMLEISVANEGTAIPLTAMERLFQPFFRGEGRSSQQGLGLGLHIASEIAKAHDGALSVQSAAGETRFTLTMPAIRSARSGA